jgi:hypothetical protein
MVDVGAGVKEAEKVFFNVALPMIVGAAVVAIVKKALKK